MPSERKPRIDGERTREAIVREAVGLATVDGLEGLSIGNLAGANTNCVLREDPAALDMARTIVRRRLGITTTTAARRQRTAPTQGPRKNRARRPEATAGIDADTHSTPRTQTI